MYVCATTRWKNTEVMNKEKDIKVEEEITLPLEMDRNSLKVFDYLLIDMGFRQYFMYPEITSQNQFGTDSFL